MKRVIDGRFELVDRLGGGGMGTVWRARDLALHRDVALKEVRPPDPAYADVDPEGARTLRARVLREARALARIDHPNVVTIHHIVDAGDEGAATYPWLVMELVTGGSLQDRLDRGPMAPADAARLGRDVLAALRAAHAGGIEHRDVKPANVLLRPDGRPVLTDFGIAALRESTSLTATGSVIGSPDYMAPERVRGQSGGPAGDLWSLALMLYVAVEGHHPLRRENTLATLAAVLDDEVPPPRRAGALTGALASVLVRDPQARPDAEALDAMLAAAVGEDGANGADSGDDAPGAPTTSYRLSPPTPPPSNVPRPSPAPPPPNVRRARTNMAAVAVAGATLAGILLWGVLHWSQGESTETAGRGGTTGTTGRTGAPTARAAVPGADQSSTPEKPAGQPAEKPDLLTPDGIRTAIQKLKPVIGGTKVTRFVVYPEHVSAEALVKGSEKRYDRFGYRGGEVAVREGAGGTITNGDVPADLSSFDWKALPELLRKARRNLGVDRPTSRYLVVTPASTVFGNGPSMSVYLSDAYGSGYLKADTGGKVIATYPREK